MPFTLTGVARGFRMAVPLAISVGAYGLVFGMLAQKNGMQWPEAVGMSLSVFAGASQIVAMDLWHSPLPMVTLILTTLVVNARHFLMGAAIQPWFRNLHPAKAYGSLFFCADENWALAMKEFRNGESDRAFLLGGGLAIYLGWNLSTIVGYLGGLTLQNPARYGLDFAFTAVFIALVMQMWRGKKDLLPWITAALASLIAAHFLAGKWYILIGALSGSIMGVLRYDD